jgi:hypothetical protein
LPEKQLSVIIIQEKVTFSYPFCLTAKVIKKNDNWLDHVDWGDSANPPPYPSQRGAKFMCKNPCDFTGIPFRQKDGGQAKGRNNNTQAVGERTLQSDTILI